MNLLTAQWLGLWERAVCAPCNPPHPPHPPTPRPHQGLLGFALFSGRLEDVVLGLDAQPAGPLTPERLSSRGPESQGSPYRWPSSGPSSASLPRPLIVDPAHASLAVVLIKLRGIGHNVVRDEHFCLIRSSRYPAPPPPPLAATHARSGGAPGPQAHRGSAHV